jgi:hypothetical protein
MDRSERVAIDKPPTALANSSCASPTLSPYSSRKWHALHLRHQSNYTDLLCGIRKKSLCNLVRPTPIQLPTADVPAGVALQLVSGWG